MTFLEEYEKQERDYEISQRIGEFFGIPKDEAHCKPPEENEHIMFGLIDPVNIDNLGNETRDAVSAGSLSTNKRIAKANHEINRMSIDRLRKLVHRFPMDEKFRFVFYLANMRLSELGVAPRFRHIRRLSAKPSSSERGMQEVQHLRDVQVFDLEWLHRQHPGHRIRNLYLGVFQKLLKEELFDYGVAHMIASAGIKTEKKVAALRLTEDMQAGMCILRSKSLDRKQRALEAKLEEVEFDLITAAHRNPRRGAKLLNVIPDRLNVWRAIAMTSGKSESLMLENYTKLSGKQINRSTFKSKMNSLNKALNEVKSKHAFTEEKSKRVNTEAKSGEAFLVC